MSEERIIELETRLAYQEETLRVLNEALSAQQRRIDQLDATCRLLLQRSTEAALGLRGTTADERPPHY